MLAKRLEEDEMLAGLFRFNIRVVTRNGNKYLVDLVWTEGKIRERSLSRWMDTSSIPTGELSRVTVAETTS